MKIVLLMLIVISTLIQNARAESNVPSQLVIGYDNEGEVDPSRHACRAHAEAMGFSEEGAAKYVCAARKRYADAYAALQSNYRAFVEAFSEDTRLYLPEAVSNLKTLIKACMDHKFDITTGGHHVMMDIIENSIRAGCLTLGSNLIKDETTKYKRAAGGGPIVDRVEAIRKGTFLADQSSEFLADEASEVGARLDALQREVARCARRALDAGGSSSSPSSSFSPSFHAFPGGQRVTGPRYVANAASSCARSSALSGSSILALRFPSRSPSR